MNYNTMPGASYIARHACEVKPRIKRDTHENKPDYRISGSRRISEGVSVLPASHA